MQRKKCLRTLALALITATAAPALSGAATARTYKTIHQFELPKGPTGNLTIDAAGNLYGTTFAGGSAACNSGGCGVVWELVQNPSGIWGTLSVLHEFTGADGANPWLAGLVFDPAGNLYGTTNQGGASTGTETCPVGCGAVFKLAPNPDGTWTESVLYSFTGGADGSNPVAGLIFDAASNLYGITSGGGEPCEPSGCGTVFKLKPEPDGTWTESVLYSFTGGADGAGPYAGLIFDAAGNLYGTTALGGGSGCNGFGCGVVFELAPNPDGIWTERVVYSFTGGADGGYPQAGLILDAAGNLYGTTYYGGSTACPVGCGVVFKLAPNSDGTWTESALHGFTGGAGGANPYAGLIFDAAGNLYGTTTGGGDYNACSPTEGCGVVFKLAPTSSGWSETVLHSFLGLAAHPFAPVIFDQRGNLYGTTCCGNTNYGVVFEITP
jgi:uncharacterized repeat protein (TIGR03803 family)